MGLAKASLTTATLVAATGLLMALAPPALAGSITLAPVSLPVWKAVYGQVEARTTAPARARIGGTLVSLTVTEGDMVTAGQVIGTLQDDKIGFEVTALDAQLRALGAQLDNAQAELSRGQTLLDRGVATTQQLDLLSTQADVVRNQIAATEAQREVVLEQAKEGAVLAPADGKVLTVPVTEGAVIMPGEAIATIGGGGFFLRLAIPERYASLLEQGASLRVETGQTSASGTLVKLYPQIENGRVVADVDVGALPTAFVNARLLVRVPVGKRQALMLPVAALTSRAGLDFVTVKTAQGTSERAVVLGEVDGETIEILTGLAAGDQVVTP
ncbi:MAG: efflux RND transporter periplasmic adaptor subunit [Devosia sp.]